MDNNGMSRYMENNDVEGGIKRKGLRGAPAKMYQKLFIYEINHHHDGISLTKNMNIASITAGITINYYFSRCKITS